MALPLRVHLPVAAGLVLLGVLVTACGGGGGGSSGAETVPAWQAATGNCVGCHQGIETAHLRFPLGCAQCHGGDPTALTKAEAHVQPQAPLPQNATILPQDYADLAYLRFVNPTNLRVVRQTCGQSGAGLGAACHGPYVDDVMKSMMATTAGHLASGAYENGILQDRTPLWANMPIADTDGTVPPGAVASLAQMPAELTSYPMDSFERHYSDVSRKICMRCHLWSRGDAVRGVPGKRGNYRSEGCAACHMPYSNDAFSETGDPTVSHTEPGHPLVHRLTKAVPTDQCTHCHIRGARIGLSYRGMAQTPPGTPTGPNYPGLTPQPIHGGYQYQNPEVNPPDIHFERGMHCIDCHVRPEIMGDGNIYGHMDRATQVECQDCHGTPDAYGPMATAQGTPLTHLRWQGNQMILTSKVTGVQHVVPQVKNIVDPGHTSFNPLAAASMNANHLRSQGGLECYTCHSAWQSNCYGCHFNRDLGQTALDFVAGQPTAGKPVTDDKYFVNFKAFHMGWNAEGKAAPYVVGCQVLATVKDAAGQTIMKQKLPVTAAGRSGLSLNPVQPHTTRTTPRWCVECHRNPAALGLGTGSFNLTRSYLFSLAPAPAGALAVIDRSTPATPVVAASIPLPDPRRLAVVTDQLSGRARVAYVADGALGLVAVDLAVPAAPAVASALPAADLRDVAVAGSTLFAAGGAQGLLVYDLSQPLQPVLLATLPTVEARAVAVHGLHALVADGPGGIVVADVRQRAAPQIVSVIDLNGANPAPNDAWDVFPFPHYGDAPFAGEKPFEMLLFVADGIYGVRTILLDNPALPWVIASFPTTDARALVAKYHYDKGTPSTASRERDYLFVADGAGGLIVLNVVNPLVLSPVATLPVGGPALDVIVHNAFEPPNNRNYAYVAAGGAGCQIWDFSSITAPSFVAAVPLVAGTGLDLERVVLDRFIDEDGAPIKDQSHDGARPFDRTEIERILGAGL